MPTRPSYLYYRMLNEKHEIVLTDDVLVWAKWFENHPELRLVGLEQVGENRVTTFFRATAHNFPTDDLFETLIESPAKGERSYFYTSWEEAEKGHRQLVQFLTEGGPV